MAARRENRTRVNPKPLAPNMSYWFPEEPVVVEPVPAREVDPASIVAGESCPPAFEEFQAALDAARVLAFQWAEWVSVVAAQTARGFLVLTGAHREYLETRLLLVEIGPEGQVACPFGTLSPPGHIALGLAGDRRGVTTE